MARGRRPQSPPVRGRRPDVRARGVERDARHGVTPRRPRPASASHVRTLHTVEGDVLGAVEAVSVPSYAIDATGVIRWINPAAERLVGDVRGRQFTSVVAAEDTRRARQLFARKLAGTAAVTDAAAVLLDADGARVGVEISSVPLRDGH